MAVNVYSLKASSITTSTIGLTITPGTATGTLDAADFIIKKLNGDTFDTLIITTDYTVNPVSQTAATINFTANPAIDTGSLLLIQINDTVASELSDRIMVDFAENYDDTNHDADYKFELPAEVGSYKMQLDTVNGSDFSTVDSAEFEVGDEPVAVDCSITIAKDYLVKYTGEVIDLTVVLDNNTAGKVVPAGNYEVSLDADLQA